MKARNEKLKIISQLLNGQKPDRKPRQWLLMDGQPLPPDWDDLRPNDIIVHFKKSEN